jgi:hypothetical protein
MNGAVRRGASSMEVGTIILLEICAVHESLHGPERRLLRDSKMSGVRCEADVERTSRM